MITLCKQASYAIWIIAAEKHVLSSGTLVEQFKQSFAQNMPNANKLKYPI